MSENFQNTLKIFIKLQKFFEFGHDILGILLIPLGFIVKFMNGIWLTL